MSRPIEVAWKLCPKARPSYLAAIENGDALFLQHDITTPLRLAHFLAQVFHETGGLTVERESGAYSAKRLVQIFGVGHHSAGITQEEAARLAFDGPAIFERVYGLGNPKKAEELGNLQPGDGYRYRGGGILQTTGRANYRRMGKKCGVDFERMPSLIFSAEHTLKPALAEWSEGNLNAAADSDDIHAITKRVNGGYNGLADREAWYRRIRPLIDKVDIAAPTPRQPPPDIEPAPAPKSRSAVSAKEVSAAGSGAAAAGTAYQTGLPWWLCVVIALLVVATVYGAFHLFKRKD